MTVQALALRTDDFSMMREAAGQAGDLAVAAAAFESGECSFWPEVHDNPTLLPRLMDAFIASERRGVLGARKALSHLVGWRALQLLARGESTPLVQRARCFAPSANGSFIHSSVAAHSLRDLVAFQYGGDSWTYEGGRFPRFVTPLGDSSGKEAYSLALSTDARRCTAWISVLPGKDHSAEFKGREGELDIRVEGKPVEVGVVDPRSATSVQGYLMARPRLLTAKAFGRFHSALFIRSARFMGR